MSNYRQNYTPPSSSTEMRIWFALSLTFIIMLLVIGGEEEDTKHTAEAKLSAALDDAYQAGVRDAQRECRK